MLLQECEWVLYDNDGNRIIPDENDRLISDGWADQQYEDVDGIGG